MQYVTGEYSQRINITQSSPEIFFSPIDFSSFERVFGFVKDNPVSLTVHVLPVCVLRRAVRLTLSSNCMTAVCSVDSYGSKWTLCFPVLW